MTRGHHLLHSLLRAAVPLVMLVALAAGRSEAGDPTPKRPHLKVLYGRYLSFAPIAIARAEGFFSAQGLDVELVHASGSSDATPALVRGDLAVVAGALRVSELNAIARGAEIRIVADKGHYEAGPCVSAALVARPEFLRVEDPGSPAHLRDARVSAIPLSYAEYVLETFLEAKGLKLADLRVVTLQEAEAAAALAEGSLDLQQMGEPFLTQARRSGRTVIWKPTVEIVPGGQTAVILFGPRLLTRDREAGERFMVAYLQGVRRYQLGKTPRNVEILARETRLDPDLVREACWESIRPDGKINVDSVLDYERWAVRRGLLDASLPPGKFWDPSFVDAANRVLGQPAP
ncbi:MAG TPA: ABC transporter substrate-binding protein [Thermoanaerobaculia bacterium]|nr:ABC transporter substrate-binding protein [Thermoanaerobaculia bacterium]